MEVYPAEKHYHHCTVTMQYALGKKVVHHLKDGEGEEEKGEEKLGKKGKLKYYQIYFLVTYANTTCTHSLYHTQPLHTNLEQVVGDNVKPLNYFLQVGIPTQNHLEYTNEELQGALV